MMRLIHSLLVVMAVQSICIADVTKLPADNQKALRDVSRFHEIPSATNLPPAVFAFCADHSGRLAGPGQKWEVSDVINNATLAQKRMIWAVTDGSLFVVHYESGGRAHGFHVLVAKLEAGHGKASFVWHGVCFVPLKDFRAFVDALATKKLDDRNDYTH
jgi:ABC-type amino acid transport substrate-binding protein